MSRPMNREELLKRQVYFRTVDAPVNDPDEYVVLPCWVMESFPPLAIVAYAWIASLARHGAEHPNGYVGPLPLYAALCEWCGVDIVDARNLIIQLAAGNAIALEPFTEHGQERSRLTVYFTPPDTRT